MGVLSVMTLGIPSQGGTWVEASSSPLLFSKFKCFISCPGFIFLCWAGVSHPLRWSGLLRKTLVLVNCLGVPDDSQGQMSSLKLRSPSNLPGVEVNWTFFIISSSLREFLSFSSELSSTGGGYYRRCWSVTPCDLNWFGILFCLLKSSHLHSLPSHLWMKTY